MRVSVHVCMCMNVVCMNVYSFVSMRCVCVRARVCAGMTQPEGSQAAGTDLHAEAEQQVHRFIVNQHRFQFRQISVALRALAADQMKHD